MLILVRPHTSLLDGPAVARFLPTIGVYQSVFAVDPDYALHPVYGRLLKAYGWIMAGATMLPLDAARPQALRDLLKLLRAGRPVVVFPQGTGLSDPDRPDRPGSEWLIRKAGGAGVMELTIRHDCGLWPDVQLISGTYKLHARPPWPEVQLPQ